MSNRRKPAPDAPGGSLADVVDDLDKGKHLTWRQRQAVALFLRDLRASHGSSDGLVGDLTAPKIQAGLRARLWPPGGNVDGNLAQVDARLNRLRPHERQLMGSLIKYRELTRGSLSDLGRIKSGYKARRDQIAVSVGRIGALLDSLADEYLGSEPV